MEIDTPDGPAILEKIYFTELGHVMAKFYFKDQNIWIRKRISSLDSLLNGNSIVIKNPLIFKRKKLPKY